jgi:hypothetical protein
MSTEKRKGGKAKLKRNERVKNYPTQMYGKNNTNE